jgi:putative selenium metabolism hydrolase
MSEDGLSSFVQALIRTPSFSGNESEVVDLILSEMRAVGFDSFWRDDCGSAVGVVAGGEPGPTLLLCGHCDTVGIAAGADWRHNPFGGEIEDGRIYGRGAADMKGGLAAMVHAAASSERARLRGRVVVAATVHEENFEGAALRAIVGSIQPDFVVIGEATELNLNRGGRGRAEIQLETVGRPAHSSNPEVGRNAVLDMLPIVAALAALPVRDDPLLGPAICVLTDIISDPYPGCSVIPSRCRATFDRRLLTSETAETVLAEFQQLAAAGNTGTELHVHIAEAEHRTYTGELLSGPKFMPAWTFAEDHPFVAAALRGLRSAGIRPSVGAYRFCTDAAYSAGTAGIPTVGFGPGRERDAHVIDESLSLDELLAARRGYQGIIAAVCGKGVS